MRHLPGLLIVALALVSIGARAQSPEPWLALIMGYGLSRGAGGGCSMIPISGGV